MTPTYLTTRETADRLGVTERTLYRWKSQGKIRSYRDGINRTHKFNAAEVDALLALHPVTAADTAA